MAKAAIPCAKPSGRTLSAWPGISSAPQTIQLRLLARVIGKVERNPEGDYYAAGVRLQELTSREAVLQAMEEFDRLGREQFLQKYGFGTSWRFRVAHDDKEYDAKAIAGAAYRFQFPDEGPLKSDEFGSGRRSTKPKLESLGFEIREADKLTPSVDRWKSAIALCRPLIEDRTYLDEEEVNYKLEIAENVRAAVKAAHSGQDLGQSIAKVLGPPNNLLHFITKGRFKEWATNDEAAAQQALEVLDGDGPASERVNQFVGIVPGGVLRSPGERLGFAALFLMGIDPAEYPMYRAEAIKGAEGLLYWPKPVKGLTDGDLYEHHRAFVREFLSRLRRKGVQARDMLDAQSLLWYLMNSEAPGPKAWRGEEITQQPGALRLDSEVVLSARAGDH